MLFFKQEWPLNIEHFNSFSFFSEERITKQLGTIESTLKDQIGELKEQIRELGGTLIASSSNSQGI